MGYAAKVLADSLSPAGVRLTTLEVTMPRIVLAEFNTHRMLSRNSASSRAIPVEKRIAAVRADPFIPDAFGRNQKGMQAEENLDSAETEHAKDMWVSALADALGWAERLARNGVHKQLTNRLLEPFSWHTVIVTATEWDNFFALRCSPMAQPEIRRPAELMREAMAASSPRKLRDGQWHLPLVVDGDLEFEYPQLIKLSVARCARVSYLTHDGKRDPEADLVLYDRLASSGHMSPMEHVARPMTPSDYGVYVDHRQHFCGNFRGWVSHRKGLPDEAVFTGGAA